MKTVSTFTVFTLLLFTFQPDYSWSQISEYPSTIQEQQDSNITSYLIDTIHLYNSVLKKTFLQIRKSPVYIKVEEMPIFGDCVSADKKTQAACSADQLDFYFYTSCMNYKDFNNQIVEGTVICSFVVSANGYVLNPKIIKSLSLAADAKVLDLIRESVWVSGKQAGKNVNVQLTVPVTFRRIE